MKPLPDITAINRAYFEGCANGELRIRHCNACGALFRFAHAWCPTCWSADIGWRVASGRGRVTHAPIVHLAPTPAFEPDAPYALALIELEEGVRMMANVIDCDPETVHIGLDVEVCFERRSAVSLAQFRPAGGGSAPRRE